jgi:hypothetical protein
MNKVRHINNAAAVVRGRDVVWIGGDSSVQVETQCWDFGIDMIDRSRSVCLLRLRI